MMLIRVSTACPEEVHRVGRRESEDRPG
jgi:hypothetical protein